MSSVPGERGPVAAERARLQPGQSVAAARAATAHRELVAHQSPAAPRQDGWTPRTTRAVLLALPGGESPDQALVRVDTPADLGTARADGLTQDPLTEGIWRSNEARADKCLGDALKWRGAHSLRGSKSSREQTSRGKKCDEMISLYVRSPGCRVRLITAGQNGNPGQ